MHSLNLWCDVIWNTVYQGGGVVLPAGFNSHVCCHLTETYGSLKEELRRIEHVGWLLQQLWKIKCDDQLCRENVRRAWLCRQSTHCTPANTLVRSHYVSWLFGWCTGITSLKVSRDEETFSEGQFCVVYVYWRFWGSHVLNDNRSEPLLLPPSLRCVDPESSSVSAQHKPADLRWTAHVGDLKLCECKRV